jgi:hypothetical protein
VSQTVDAVEKIDVQAGAGGPLKGRYVNYGLNGANV